MCLDNMKSLAREHGVSSLPRMGVYRPGQGRLCLLELTPSRVKHLKENLETIAAHPDSSFLIDTEGRVVPTDTPIGAASASPSGGPSSSSSSSSSANSAGGSSNGAGGSGSSTDASDRVSIGSTTASSSCDGAPAAAAAAASPAPRSAAEEYVASFVDQYGPEYSLAKAEFLERYGHEYGYDGQIDALYPPEVGVRMKPLGDTHRQQHYMDYTGSSVYCQSQLEAVFDELRSTMFGNPHSANPSSQLSSDRIDEVRSQVLRFFNADPTEWQVVFTRSATGAIKTVGETFPWSKGSTFRYLRENHNSVLGVREYALAAGGLFQAVDEQFVERWLQPASEAEASAEAQGQQQQGQQEQQQGQQPQGQQPQELQQQAAAAAEASGDSSRPTYSLFAFPAEDNFAGVKYPLRWISAVKAQSTASHKWMVLLDAAAYVPTQPLDLSQLPVDFVDVAFYKMFGYPTGLGALLVRTEAADCLHKLFWGGGSVALATSNDNFHVLKCKPSDMLEDGTVAFLDIISLKHGFELVSRLGGVAKIQAHVAALTEYLYEHVVALRHSNGAPMTQVFGKHHLPNHREVQGGILNFEMLSPSGQVLSYKTFEREAAAAGFHVRTGAECNPGACYAYLGVKEAEVEALAGKKEGCEDDVEFIQVERPSQPNPVVTSSSILQTIAAKAVTLGHPAEVAMKWVQVPLGSIRASLGYMSTFEDVFSLVDFIKKSYTDRES